MYLDWRRSIAVFATLPSEIRNHLLVRYVGVIMDGRRMVCINAFRDTDVSWRRQPFILCVGGTGNWGALFDPETRRFSDLAVNGGI
jgi:hypothetical protein